MELTVDALNLYCVWYVTSKRGKCRRNVAYAFHLTFYDLIYATRGHFMVHAAASHYTRELLEPLYVLLADISWFVNKYQ